MTLYSPNGTWNVRDNLFHGITLYPNGSFDNDYNAYYQTTPISSGGGNIILSSAVSFQPGPLGRWYLPSGNGPLRNGGSRPASVGGLYHHTTQVDQSHEGAKPSGANVDVGFHYVALNPDGSLLDSDGDGLVNIAEDPDADGIKDVSETDFADADTDYDGRSDGEEMLEGTDPLNSDSAKQVALGYWRFSENTWQGEHGQMPLVANGVEPRSSWSGTAEEINAVTGGNLAYRTVEANGAANINCRKGTIRFWFKPSWLSMPAISGGGRLIELGNASSPAEGWWALSIERATGALVFQSRLNSGIVTYLTAPVSWSGNWCQIVLTYSQTSTKIYMNGQLLASGLGVQNFPTKAARIAYGFSIGSNRSGTELALGRFDELETFNFPLSPEQILDEYQPLVTLDYDRDGLTDILENDFGTSPDNMDTDGDGLPDGLEVSTYATNPLDPDTDYDGRNDGEEVKELTNPIDESSFLRTNLAVFNFNSSDFAGTRGQKPIEAVNVSQVSSWSTKSALLAAANTKLRYAAYGSDATANVNGRQATIRMWFKPNWTSGPGGGPQHQASLVDIGNAVEDGVQLVINPDGTSIGFYCYSWGALICDGPINFTAGQWVHITLAFDANNTSIYINGALVVSDWGYGYFLTLSALRAGMSLGTSVDGSQRVDGELEDVSIWNYMLSGTDILQDFQSFLNIEKHSVNVPRFLNSSSVFVQVNAGPLSTMAYLLNSQDFANAVWGAPNSFTLGGLAEGENTLWVGFRDPTGKTVWFKHRIIRDLTPPQITITKPAITDPVATIVKIPMIQVHGYANEELSKISFSVQNSAGTFSDGLTVVRAPVIDPATQTLQVPFRCLDIDLAPGNNHIFVHAWDKAGNEAIREVVYALDYSGVTQGPAILSQWPLDGAQLSGNTFTLRGYVDDPTATIHVTIAAGGAATERDAIVERDGLFWLENLPLNSGANQVTLSLQNAAGFETISSFTVYRSALQIGIDPVSPPMLYNRTTTVTGTITEDAPYTVWVNGVRATMQSGGLWSAQKVPVNEGGTATFHATAIPNTQNEGNGTPAPPNTPLNNVASQNPTASGAADTADDEEKPSIVLLKTYNQSDSESCEDCWDPCDPDYGFSGYVLNSGSVNYERTKGGKLTWSRTTHWCETHDDPDPDISKVSTYEYEAEWDADDKCRWRARDDGGEWSGWDESGYAGCPPPPGPWVHVDYSDSAVAEPFDATFKFSYNAQTEVELHTGGKSKAKQSHLFSISAYIGVHEWFPFQEPNGPLTVGALGEAGLDGRLYRVLPDGEVMSATVEAPGSTSYGFGVSQTKHIATLRANGQPMKEKEVTPETTFCVGQSIVFTLDFDPRLTRLESKDTIWNLTGTFANAEATSISVATESGVQRVPMFRACYPNIPLIIPDYSPVPGPDCEAYFIHDPLLRQDSTGAWWYDKGINSAGCTMSLEFKNGQTVQVLRIGKFEVKRPTASLQPPETAAYFVVRDLGFWIIGRRSHLSLGDDQTGAGAMRFGAQVTSDLFSGQAAWTQLVTVDSSLAYCSHCLDNVEFEGQSFVASEKYKSEHPELNFENTSVLEDQPGQKYYSVNRLQMSFTCYLRFKPTGGIWVTLGVTSWNIHGEAKYSSTTGWSLIQNTINPPTTLTDSTAFPFWTEVFYNRGLLP